jgi:hypothetical protein
MALFLDTFDEASNLALASHVPNEPGGASWSGGVFGSTALVVGGAGHVRFIRHPGGSIVEVLTSGIDEFNQVLEIRWSNVRVADAVLANGDYVALLFCQGTPPLSSAQAYSLRVQGQGGGLVDILAQHWATVSQTTTLVEDFPWPADQVLDLGVTWVEGTTWEFWWEPAGGGERTLFDTHEWGVDLRTPETQDHLGFNFFFSTTNNAVHVGGLEALDIVSVPPTETFGVARSTPLRAHVVSTAPLPITEALDTFTGDPETRIDDPAYVSDLGFAGWHRIPGGGLGHVEIGPAQYAPFNVEYAANTVRIQTGSPVNPSFDPITYLSRAATLAEDTIDVSVDARSLDAVGMLLSQPGVVQSCRIYILAPGAHNFDLVEVFPSDGYVLEFGVRWSQTDTIYEGVITVARRTGPSYNDQVTLQTEVLPEVGGSLSTAYRPGLTYRHPDLTAWWEPLGGGDRTDLFTVQAPVDYRDQRHGRLGLSVFRFYAQGIDNSFWVLDNLSFQGALAPPVETRSTARILARAWTRSPIWQPCTPPIEQTAWEPCPPADPPSTTWVAS